ncbi:hypothetical protein BG011_003666 [Mortierella polycephala]|uniref:Uncharacterized protein n=1 Tax=Mortierella polycephala TaxID=41804 RepID=A0A9P6U3R5_9FUNG|nr:hypothetical protein BG011_003666 [Mortierella polycephala]
MAPHKKQQQQQMPSMKELQNLLAQLDAEGNLGIGGGDSAESANLDDLYEDSYFHAILHNNIQQGTIKVKHSNSSKDGTDDKVKSQDQDQEQDIQTLSFTTLTLPKECYWGDDHESLGPQLLVRPGYAAVLTALLTPLSSSSSPSIYMAVGPSGIGKSCLAYYLSYKLFEAGHNVVVSDPIFTNAFINRQYYSCYSPHLEKHQDIFKAISTAPTSDGTTSAKATWWICDDGFLPIKGTQCQTIVTSMTTSVDRDVETIRKKNKLALPVQFQIPAWSLDEIKAGSIVSLSTSAHGTGLGSSSATLDAVTNEQEAYLETLFIKYKGNPGKIFTWIKENWVESDKSGSGTGSKPNKSKMKGKAKTKKP